jgi:ClpP class serine protease
MNRHCQDLESHWCRNFKGNCATPPAHVKEARALMDAADELLHAAHVVSEYGHDYELADAILGMREKVQQRALERSRAPLG